MGNIAVFGRIKYNRGRGNPLTGVGFLQLGGVDTY
jgi:hypothetical protein